MRSVNSIYSIDSVYKLLRKEAAAQSTISCFRDYQSVIMYVSNVKVAAPCLRGVPELRLLRLRCVLPAVQCMYGLFVMTRAGMSCLL